LAVQVAAAGLTLRGALVVRKRGYDIFIEEIGEIGFPALREYVRPAIGSKNATQPGTEAALAEDPRDSDF
jgi:hypothetical protein